MIDYILQIVTSPVAIYIVFLIPLCYIAYQAGIANGFKKATITVKTTYRDTFIFPNGTYGFFTEDHKMFILIDQVEGTISRTPVEEGAAVREKENRVERPPHIILDDDNDTSTSKIQ